MKTIVLIILSAVLLALLYAYLPVGLDWHDAYRPAALNMIHGQSPYEDTPAPFMNAPWTLLPFLPFALLPYQVGRVGVFLMGLFSFAFVAYRLKAKPVIMLIFLTSASVIGCLNNGNLDWLPLLAIVMPAPVALIFAAMKPQIGIGIILYWLIISFRDGGIRQTIKVFAPLTVLTLLSFALYGFWFMKFTQMEGNINNMSIFPYGMIVGIVALWLSLRKRGNDRLAIGASPFFAPYVSQFSWAAVLVPFFDRPWVLAAVSFVLWIPVIYRVLIQ